MDAIMQGMVVALAILGCAAWRMARKGPARVRLYNDRFEVRRRA